MAVKIKKFFPAILVVLMLSLTGCAGQGVYESASASTEKKVTATPEPVVEELPHGMLAISDTDYMLRCWEGEPCIAQFPGYEMDCLIPEMADDQGRLPNAIQVTYQDSTRQTVVAATCAAYYDGYYENLQKQ